MTQTDNKIEILKERFMNLVFYIVIQERNGETKLESLWSRRIELANEMLDCGINHTEILAMEMEAIEQGFKADRSLLAFA